MSIGIRSTFAVQFVGNSLKRISFTREKTGNLIALMTFYVNLHRIVKNAKSLLQTRTVCLPWEVIGTLIALDAWTAIVYSKKLTFSKLTGSHTVNNT